MPEIKFTSIFTFMNTIFTDTYLSPVGELILGSRGDKICLCDWKFRKQREQTDLRLRKFFNTDFQPGTSLILEETKLQLDSYFQGKRKSFELEFALAGSPFQLAVWKLLQEIPYGETISYLALSRKWGNENGIRAVASANGANALSILIPCHRVIGSKGELTGYAGGLNAKSKLLELEGALFSQKSQLKLF